MIHPIVVEVQGALGMRRRFVADSITVTAAVACVCIPVWPGIFTVDSQSILRWALRGRISDWYAPLHGWVWGFLDRMGVGPGGVFVLGVTAFTVGVLALAKQFLPDGKARLATMCTVLFPSVYGLLGWVGRDVWFATAALGITAGSLHVLRRGPPAPLWPLIVLFVLSVAAADSRQNGAPFALLGAGVAGQAMVRRVRPLAPRSLRAGATVVVLGLFGASFLVGQRAVVADNLHSEQYLYARDLVAVSLAGDEPLLDEALFPSQNVDLLRWRLAGRDPEAAAGLDPPLLRYDPFDATLNKAWSSQWLRLVRKHPLRYLESRTRLYGDQVGISGDTRSPYFGRSDDLGWRVDEFAHAFPRLLEVRNRLLSWGLGSGAGSLLDVPLGYIAGSILAIGVLGRRTGRTRWAVLLLLVLAIMQAGLFFFAGTSEFRFQYFQVVVCVSLCSILLVSPLPLGRGRPARRRPGPVPTAAGQDSGDYHFHPPMIQPGPHQRAATEEVSE